MTKRIVFLPDYQMPYEDRKLVKAQIRFIGDYQPDEVIHIGDLVDYPQPSRWNKDTRGEFEGSIYQDSEYTKRNFLSPLRAAYDGPVKIHEGNHDLRPRDYLRKYAPALEGPASEAFNFENLLDFAGFGVERAPDFYEFAHNWVSTHGHLGKIGLSRIAGNTALNAAKRFGKSLIMGHTHRLGMSSYSYGYDSKIVNTLTGIEVGNGMNMKLAQYLNKGTADWQQGLVVMHVDGKHVAPTLVPVVAGRFTVEGVTYKI